MEVLKNLPSDIKENLQRAPFLNQINEIRLRVNKPLAVTIEDKTYFVSKRGQTTQKEQGTRTITRNEVEETLTKICEMSLYSFQNQINNGFVTIKGGHRAGISGSAVMKAGEITNIKDVSGINIRIARQIIGASDRIYSELFENNIENTLIISPPNGGKTTILRDLARNISCSMRKVAVIDERGEIAAVYDGIPQNDVGANTDVLDSYKKSDGIVHAVRTLSPQVIICDEIGTNEDIAALNESLRLGVPIIATAHAKTVDDVKQNQVLSRLIQTKALKNIVVLEARKIKEIV